MVFPEQTIYNYLLENKMPIIYLYSPDCITVNNQNIFLLKSLKILSQLYLFEITSRDSLP